jgi:hypothetical protein
MERDAGLPAWFTDQAGPTGLENIGPDDVTPHYLRIAQFQSKAIEPNEAEYVEGLQVGGWYNTIARIPYGSSVDVVVVGYAKNWIEWDGEGAGAKFVRSLTSKQYAEVMPLLDLRGRYMVDGSSHRIQEARNFFVVLKDRPQDGVMIYAATGMSVSGARTLATMLHNKKFKGLPVAIWKTVWRVSSVYDSNERGKFYKLGGIEDHGLTPDDLVPMVRDATAQFSTFVPAPHDVE